MTRAGRVALAVWLLLLAGPAWAQQRYAIIISGATGGQEYARQYNDWTMKLSAILTERFRIEPSHVTLLTESDRPTASATAANVRKTLGALAHRTARGDLLFLLLIGHGTFDGTDAKFNLVGPDLESAEWATLLKTIPAQLVVVNSTAASYPFLERLAAPRRVVITSTDSAAQRFDTVFPGYFINAFAEDAADLDKNGRISVWEAFAAASAGVRRHYQQRGQLSTERALLDDNGDGIGNDAVKPADDGSQASRIYLDEPSPGAAPTDDVLLKLLQRRTTLETEVGDLKIRRTFMPPDEYAAEFERLMIELATVSRDIRLRQKT